MLLDRRLILSPLLLSAVLFAGCQDVAITQQPEREGDDPGECSDNADNDSDGFFDCEDPDCTNAPECLPNSPPIAPEIRIEPWIPTTTDNLSCVIDVPSVDDEDDEITYTYRWEVEGADGGTETTVDSANTAKHQVWTCYVTASDPVATGGTATASVTIENTAPTQPGVSIQPGTPNVDAPLRCSVTTDSFDADGDSVSYTYNWELNGSSAGVTGPNIDASATSTNDSWKCIVTPEDDEEEGPTGSDTVEVHFDVIPHVTTGRWHSCAIAFDGSYSCWGSNAQGQRAGPAEAFGLVSVGEQHSCGMTLDGTVRCWGFDDDNQGSDPFGTFSALGDGYNHSCGVLNTQEVSCWGTANNWSAAPPAGPWTSVTGGNEFACARADNGLVSCWNGLSSPAGNFSQIDAGGAHACGVRTDGTVDCWGSDSHGQVSGAPGGSTWIQVSAGHQHSCAIDGDDFSVTCWGQSANGQLNAPGGMFDQVDAGWTHTCGVRSNGQVACWGCFNDDQGQCNP